MNMRFSKWMTGLSLVVVIAFSAGCDFNAASDAFDEFDVIIELESINTVVNGIIQDASTNELVDAQLTITGPDADNVIDAYSDPVDEINAEGGTVTFGIRNSFVPSNSNPANFVVTIEADGYFTRTRELAIRETGDAQFIANMTPRNIEDSNVALAGTSSSTNDSGNSQQGTGTTQSVTVQTQQANQTQTQAQATVSVPQGTVPLTKEGVALTGQLSTTLRVFDSAQGMASLPSGARSNPDGTNQSIAGAAFFKMSDAGGNVAADFTPGSTGKTEMAGKGQTQCENGGGTALVLRSTNSSLIAGLNATGGMADGNVFAFTPADGANNQIATVPVTLDGGEARAELCFGGSNANADVSAIGDAADGFIYTFALDSSVQSTQTLDHSVSISNPNGSSTQVRFTLAGPGLTETDLKIVTSGPSTLELGTLVGQNGSVSIFSGVDYALTAQVATGEATATTISDPSSGSSSITLPTTSALSDFDITASLECDDPINEKFEVQITDGSLDAVSVFYREDGSGDSWTLLPRSAITSKSATDATIDVVAKLSLLPSTKYRFRGTLADNSTSATETTPGSAGQWSIKLDASDVGIDCVSR